VGHDGFLVESEALNSLVEGLLSRVGHVSDGVRN